MKFEIDLRNRAARIGVSILLILLGLFIGRLIFLGFLIGIFSDSRVSTDRAESGLTTAIAYVPRSSKLRHRLAQRQFQEGRNLESALKNIEIAIRNSPNRHDLWVFWGNVLETNNRPEEAERAFSQAIRLAPFNLRVHWQAGNFFLRQNRLDEAVERFRSVVNLNSDLTAAIIGPVWKLSGENPTLLKRIAKDNPRSKLKLASFLAAQGYVGEAERVFGEIERKIKKDNPDSDLVYAAILNQGFPVLAQRIWMTTNNIKPKSGIFNGDFDSTHRTGPKEFVWDFRPNEFAKIQTVGETGYDGKRSLLVEFLSKDTTNLDVELRRLILPRSENRHRLTYFVKTDEFRAETPLTIVIKSDKRQPVAISEPVRTGTNDWKCVEIDFSFPMADDESDGAVFYLSLKMAPKYPFAKPTSGRVWFDNFGIRGEDSGC